MPKVPIVDAVISYDHSHSGETYLLNVRNALCVPSMAHNLFPPFIIRESGLIFNDTPKIHINNPSVEDHPLLDEELGLRIPLKSLVIFSIFPTRAFTTEEIDNVDNSPSIFFYPDLNKWDPYNESFA